MSRDQGRPRFTAFQNTGARVEQQLAAQLLRLRRMTFVALFDQRRPDLGFEESATSRRDGVAALRYSRAKANKTQGGNSWIYPKHAVDS